MRFLFPKMSLLFLWLALLATSITAHAEKSIKNQVLTATIAGYECGDNCYLTVTDDKGTQRTGLCAAPLCDAWNAKTTMPASYLGKKIRFVIGNGQQFDGGGNLMGTMEAFMQIEVLN